MWVSKITAYLSPLDVNSWLVTFGFQLYNVIPGYRKPSTESMESSYELVRTQRKTQEWDSTKVIHADHSYLSHLSPRRHRSPPCPPHIGSVRLKVFSVRRPAHWKWTPTGGSS